MLALKTEIEFKEKTDRVKKKGEDDKTTIGNSRIRPAAVSWLEKGSLARKTALISSYSISDSKLSACIGDH